MSSTLTGQFLLFLSVCMTFSFVIPWLWKLVKSAATRCLVSEARSFVQGNRANSSASLVNLEQALQLPPASKSSISSMEVGDMLESGGV